MNKLSLDILPNFFRDKNHKVIIFQPPNIPLVVWLSAKLLIYLKLPNNIIHGLWLVSSAFLVLWAYLEITGGVSPFRRVLGALVMALTIFSFYR